MAYLDLHVCLRKHTISINFCPEGLGFRGLGPRGPWDFKTSFRLLG